MIMSAANTAAVSKAPDGSHAIDQGVCDLKGNDTGVVPLLQLPWTYRKMLPFVCLVLTLTALSAASTAHKIIREMNTYSETTLKNKGDIIIRWRQGGLRHYEQMNRNLANLADFSDPKSIVVKGQQVQQPAVMVQMPKDYSQGSIALEVAQTQQMQQQYQQPMVQQSNTYPQGAAESHYGGAVVSGAAQSQIVPQPISQQSNMLYSQGAEGHFSSETVTSGAPQTQLMQQQEQHPSVHRPSTYYQGVVSQSHSNPVDSFDAGKTQQMVQQNQQINVDSQGATASKVALTQNTQQAAVQQPIAQQNQQINVDSQGATASKVALTQNTQQAAVQQPMTQQNQQTNEYSQGTTASEVSLTQNTQQAAVQQTNVDPQLLMSSNSYSSGVAQTQQALQPILQQSVNELKGPTAPEVARTHSDVEQTQQQYQQPDFKISENQPYQKPLTQQTFENLQGDTYSNTAHIIPNVTMAMPVAPPNAEPQQQKAEMPTTAEGSLFSLNNEQSAANQGKMSESPGDEAPSVNYELPGYRDTYDLPIQVDDLPVFWHIPRSGSSTVVEIMGQCHRFVMATDAGVRDGHEKDTKLMVVDIAGDAGGGASAFVNVDTTTKHGIQRAKHLGLVQSDLARVIVVHNIFDAHELFDDKHHGRLFAIFRHPVDRAISNFNYLKYADWEPTYDPELADMTLKQYAQSKHAEYNWMTWSLSGATTKNVTEEHLKAAMDVVRRKFLVGLLNRKEETMERFEQYFEWIYRVIPKNQEKCRVGLLAVGLNTSSNRNKVDKPLPGTPTYQLLVSLNELDIRLFKYIEALFDQQANFVKLKEDGFRLDGATCCKCTKEC